MSTDAHFTQPVDRSAFMSLTRADKHVVKIRRDLIVAFNSASAQHNDRPAVYFREGAKFGTLLLRAMPENIGDRFIKATGSNKNTIYFDPAQVDMIAPPNPHNYQNFTTIRMFGMEHLSFAVKETPDEIERMIELHMAKGPR